MKNLRKSEFRSADLKLRFERLWVDHFRSTSQNRRCTYGLVCMFGRKYCFHPYLLLKLFGMDSPTGNDPSDSSAKGAETLPDATGRDDLDHDKRPSDDTGTDQTSLTSDNTRDSAENPKSEDEKPSDIAKIEESSSMKSTDEDATDNVNSESSAVSSFKKEVKTSWHVTPHVTQSHRLSL